ncbi:MAG TPA: DUF4159 domain-containing protein [bacterium]|nr:DUF4159 domain-containing protein [bacterium]HPN42577.1 DUF4159 domain-containing protein [bacterium]
MKKIYCVFFLLFVFITVLAAQPKGSQFTIARLKYTGGGDWYNDPSCIPNLLAFIKQHAVINTAQDEVQVSIMDEDFFSYPVLFITGHGRITFTDKEAERLRTYLTHGGFLYADDDYGMDEHFRREMRKVFPDKDLLAIPFSHEIFHSHFEFANGLPKIHEHDGKPPAGFGYFHNGRLVVFYTQETNISDGWADAEVHGNPPVKRELALKMGMNIIVYALMN